MTTSAPDTSSSNLSAISTSQRFCNSAYGVRADVLLWARQPSATRLRLVYPGAAR